MGRLIAIEGLDGAGKNTQSEKLCRYLSTKGVAVRKIDFPNYEGRGSTLVKMYLGGELGESPDDTNPYAASAFFACDRYISYVTDWRDFLKKPDAVVVANRYTTANAYHQLAKMPREEWDTFLDWLWDFEFSKLGLPHPDDVILLMVPPEVSLANIEKRSASNHVGKDIHEKDAEYLRRCCEAAKYASEKLGWRVIDCVKDSEQMPIDDVFTEIFGALGL
jgi:dTMP kinase